MILQRATPVMAVARPTLRKGSFAQPSICLAPHIRYHGKTQPAPYGNIESVFMNPIVIQWARTTAGLSLENAAAGLAMSADRLNAIEQGDKPPSRPLLLKMSKLYRRSLLTFYLAAPPPQGDRGQDFRTLPPEHVTIDEPLLDALVRDIKARQDMVRSLIKDEEDGQPLGFVGSGSIDAGVAAARNAICQHLSINLQEYRARKSVSEAFEYLRSKAEDAGIFVLLMGSLGSHHSAISVETFRGFAIADDIAPFVIINDQDAKQAWSFTLLHEVAHIWLGATGVSGGQAVQMIETFCNEVASTFLLPRNDLSELAVYDGMTAAEALLLITDFARKRHLSRKMVSYVLHNVGRISRATWQAIDQAITDSRRREKSQKPDTDSGPSYYVVRRHRLGKALLQLINRNLGAGVISPVKAAKVLGVKPRSVYPLLIDKRVSMTALGGRL